MKTLDFKLIWNLTMSILYMGMGGFLFFFGTSVNSFNVSVNRLVGILMFGYGIFRIVRLVLSLKNKAE